MPASKQRAPRAPRAVAPVDPEALGPGVTRTKAAATAASAPSGMPELNAATIAIEDDAPASPATVEVELVGMIYEITPPKAALAMRIAWLSAERDSDPDEVFKALDGWINKAFGDQAPGLRDRLFDDEDDPLDFPHIMLLMNKLVELTSGLPTTRR